MESSLFSRFGENFRPVGRFWEISHSPTRFGQNVLRLTWKDRFVQFLWKAHCFPNLARISPQCDGFENFEAHKCDLAIMCCAWPEKSVLYNNYEKRTVLSFLERISGQCDDCENFDAHKCDLARTCCAWPEKSVLYNFDGKRTVFPFWKEFEASVTTLRTVSRSKMRFGQNVLRMTWKDRFAQFLWKAHCFPVLKRISGQFHDFENFDAQKCDLAKTCCAWPENSGLWNFHGKLTVFHFSREFDTSVTILRTLTLKSAIWPKRSAHDLKKAFCTIFMESTLFSRFQENLRQVERSWEILSIQSKYLYKLKLGLSRLRWASFEHFFEFVALFCILNTLKHFFKIWATFEQYFTFRANFEQMSSNICLLKHFKAKTVCRTVACNENRIPGPKFE